MKALIKAIALAVAFTFAAPTVVVAQDKKESMKAKREARKNMTPEQKAAKKAERQAKKAERQAKKAAAKKADKK